MQNLIMISSESVVKSILPNGSEAVEVYLQSPLTFIHETSLVKRKEKLNNFFRRVQNSYSNHIQIDFQKVTISGRSVVARIALESFDQLQHELSRDFSIKVTVLQNETGILCDF